MPEISVSSSSATQLDIQLTGGFGTFAIGHLPPSGFSASPSCLFFQTTLTLSPQDRLLQIIRPVREEFAAESLEFDEIMQRDLDDFRISTELIPYLLDQSTRDFFKLFPPIVISVLPKDAQNNKILKRYPTVTDQIVADSDVRQYTDILLTGTSYRLVRSGSYESQNETFSAAWPVLPNGMAWTTDTSMLKLSRTNSTLVLVDGQHRAMALLALYRNLWDKWDDVATAGAYKKYYSTLWPKEYLASIFGQGDNAPQIDLPCILCLYPGANTSNLNEALDVVSASRSIFLVLNKNARKVTSQRLTLLDDDNLISHIMREAILAPIKNNAAGSPETSLKIFNILLDESKDKVKISTPICISSVSNLNQLLETLMLSKRTENRLIESKAKKIGKRVDLLVYEFHGRLGTQSDNTLKNTKRNGFTNIQANELTAIFSRVYGKRILRILTSFLPYRCLTDATWNSYNSLSTDNKTEAVRELLYGNQGQYDILASFRKASARKFADSIPDHLISHVDWHAQNTILEAADNPANEELNSIAKDRTSVFLANIKCDRNRIDEAAGVPKKRISDFVDYLYANVFRSAAFQIALVCSFFKVVEDYSHGSSELEWPPAEGDSSNTIDELLHQYLNALNLYFCPSTANRLQRLHTLFRGDPGTDFEQEGQAGSRFYDIPLISADGKNRTIDPNLWPAYKYVFLELWKRPTANLTDKLIRFHDYLDSVRNVLRAAVFGQLLKGKRAVLVSYKRELTPTDEVEIETTSYEAYKQFLSSLGVTATETPSLATLREALANIEAGGLTDDETDDGEEENEELEIIEESLEA